MLRGQRLQWFGGLSYAYLHETAAKVLDDLNLPVNKLVLAASFRIVAGWPAIKPPAKIKQNAVYQTAFIAVGYGVPLAVQKAFNKSLLCWGVNFGPALILQCRIAAERVGT
jgi:hypothetical protein